MIPYPGCGVAARTKGLYGFLIRVAQTLRWSRFRKWNHMAIVTAVDGEHVTCVEMAWHCEEVPIEGVAPGGEIMIVEPPPGIDLERAVAYAEGKIGIKYGVLTIVSICLNLFTPKFLRFDFRAGRDSLICSALVARAWEHGGFDIDPIDPFQVTPAELVEMREEIHAV